MHLISMTIRIETVAVCTAVLASLMISASAGADEFMALPGLWKTTYQIRDVGTEPHEPAVVWHCVDEEADPWTSFAQLQDLPGMSCSRTSLQRTSTSLKWRIECHGAAAIHSEGAVVFDSAQHYRGWVKFSGSVMGYPLESVTDIEGTRYAACTSPAD
jgi:hypothetical protein